MVLSAQLLNTLSPSRPILNHGGRTFKSRTFAQNIRAALDGNCVGYGFAINRNGALARKGAGGFRQISTNAANNLNMGSGRRMHTASVTKTLTATAVIKAMADVGISATAKVRNYLPSAWDVHTDFNSLEISDLLLHRSGFNLAASDPHYATLRDTMENRTNRDATLHPDTFFYDNRNFALFRLILPYMVCPQIMANVEAEGWAAGDYHGAVDLATQDNYKFLMRHYVFNPLGMQRMDCRPDPENDSRTMCYLWPGPIPSVSQDGGDKSDEAGSEGWVMSARQLAKFLRMRRYSDSFLPPDLRAEMDDNDNQFGWLTIEGDEGTYLRHGGAYGTCTGGTLGRGSGPLRTCIMQFPIQVEAAVMVNSFVGACANLDRIVADAFDAAYT
jgi:CubicO group peptidase (beta-lactamase class C family)